MKPAKFEYHRPETVEETAELLDRFGHEAEVMAGNQSLGIMLSTRLATPDHVIDVNRVADLSGIRVEGTPGAVEVGAMTRHREIERSEALAEHLPMLPEAAEQIAGPAVRNRGTLGGSVGEADPAGNYPCALVALEGEIQLASVDGRREVEAGDYFVAYMFTERQENELITGARIDTSPWPMDRSGMAFQELKRAAQTWPTVSAAAAIRVDDPGAASPVVEEARLALANAAEIPLRVDAAEDAVEGGSLSDGDLDAVGDSVRDVARPDDELHADGELKVDAAAEYAKRSLRTAYDRATS